MTTVTLLRHDDATQAEGTLNTELVELIEDYLRYRRRTGAIAPRTVANYRTRLRCFAGCVGDKPLHRIDIRDVDRWLERHATRPASVAGYLSTLRTFWRWGQARGLLGRDPSAGIDAPRRDEFPCRAITAEQVGAVLDACRTRRERLLVLLGVQEGLRCVEMAEAQIGDIDWRARMLAVRGKGGRGRVTDTIPISEETWAALHAYLAERPASSGPLIRSETCEQGIGNARVSQILAAVFRRAGVKHAARDGFGGHSLRHTMLQDLVDAGVEFADVQAAARHRNAATTATYIRRRRTPERLRVVMAGRRYGA